MQKQLMVEFLSMKSHPSLFFLLTMFWFGGTASANASGWTITDSKHSEVSRLSYGGFATEGIHYLFMCDVEGLSISETGVTLLMDPKTGRKVEDGPGSQMLSGAAFLGLATDTVDPKLIPAISTPNEVRGWDLTIKLPLTDPAVRGLPTAKAVSLMTTGWTGLVELGPDDRELIQRFLAGCSAR